MKDELKKPVKRTPHLFDRVAAILEDARASVVRTVNTRMVIAYWLIGREIVQEEQGGKRRAGYGDALLEDLSRRLTERYGKGYSVSSLRDFRQFHLNFVDRLPQIHHTTCGELAEGGGLPVSASQASGCKQSHTACGKFMESVSIRQTSSDELRPAGFAPQLSWSHYRLLMRVENVHARSFYEVEAIHERWKVADLERQINSLLFERLLKSRNKKGVMALARKGSQPQKPADILKDPFVLGINYYDRALCAPDDSPTVGLILCTDRNESMVQYTLPKGQKQIFAARYRTALPSEEELVKFLRRDWELVVREHAIIYGRAQQR